jgi:uncharacterized repeat protein (TIGR03803 family)
MCDRTDAAANSVTCPRCRKGASRLYYLFAVMHNNDINLKQSPTRIGFALRRACVVLLSCVSMSVATCGQTTFTVLASFDGTDGAYPYLGTLVQGTDGNFYGTTSGGGANNAGTVFKITPSGTLTTLHSFDSTDGANPDGGLFLAANGVLYGTTSSGGADGYGTVFKITESGTLTVLHSFDQTDGASPAGSLLQSPNTNFYGTTYAGGANGVGSVFSLSEAGTLTTLHSFDSTDGANPYGGLVQAADGTFYGTTSAGGAQGYGTVFEITAGGTLTTLHSFQGTDGAVPKAALVQAADGTFYGTTTRGGANGGQDGTVFTITQSGTLATLYSFQSPAGATPSGLVQATDGNFYGTTFLGGDGGKGSVFSITPSGVLTTLHAFEGAMEGFEPYDAPLQATDGTFYGTTYSGPTYSPTVGYGTVFSLSVGLGAFVTTLPTSGKVGATVRILGTNLTGTVSVTFNGTPAKVTSTSATEITAVVPAGATTGKVEVTMPSGTLTSNVAFLVLP